MMPGHNFYNVSGFFYKLVIDLAFFVLFYLLESGREGEREGERNIVKLPLACPQPWAWPAIQACVLTREQTSDLLVCRLALNLPAGANVSVLK